MIVATLSALALFLLCREIKSPKQQSAAADNVLRLAPIFVPAHDARVRRTR